MITTFPGVYVASTLLVRSAAALAGLVPGDLATWMAAQACETTGLRLCNICFAMGSYFCSW